MGSPNKLIKPEEDRFSQVSELMKVSYFEQFENLREDWEMHISKADNLVRLSERT